MWAGGAWPGGARPFNAAGAQRGAAPDQPRPSRRLANPRPRPRPASPTSTARSADGASRLSYTWGWRSLAAAPEAGRPVAAQRGDFLSDALRWTYIADERDSSAVHTEVRAGEGSCQLHYASYATTCWLHYATRPNRSPVHTEVGSGQGSPWIKRQQRGGADGLLEAAPAADAGSFNPPLHCPAPRAAALAPLGTRRF